MPSPADPPFLASVCLLAFLGAQAQGSTPLIVMGTAGALSPSPIAPQAQVTSTLSATVYNTPVANYTQQIQGPNWQWSLGTVQYSPTQAGPFQPAPAGSYSVLIDQPNGGAPAATLTALFNLPGMWMITTTASVSYTDFPATDTWAGSGTVGVGGSVYTAFPSPTLALTANQYAICAGGHSDVLHQATLTATVTDGQGHPSFGVLVDFSRTDGGLSATSATTNLNGQAQTTLTSSQNASDGSGQYFATVTATLDTQQSINGTVQIEFQPPTLSLTASPAAISAGDTSQLALVLTWNGSTVQGHAISWRIAQIWDVNQQLIYNDSGNPPQGYLALTGTQQAASLTNQQGQASQSAQAGSTPGNVGIGARDQSVQGAQTKTNPEKRIVVAAGTQVLLKSLEFTSYHAVPCDGGDVFTAGKRFTKPEWTTAGDNNPITHTAGAATNISIKVTLTADKTIAANSAFTLTGTSTENALVFTAKDTDITPAKGLSQGDNVISLTATNPSKRTFAISVLQSPGPS